MSTSRFWLYTYYPHEEDEKHRIYNKLILVCNYFCYGVEKCPTTGRIHHQGYLELRKSREKLTVANYLNKSHVEMRNGTQEQAITYCKKDGDFHEWGVKFENKQGKRNDLESIKESIITNNIPLRDVVINQCENFQQIKYAESLYKYKKVKRNWKPIVRWYHGPSGTGKTARCVHEAGENRWMTAKDLRWWDGYDGQENVIFDDFRADFCKMHELLRILDRYEYRVEFKGGSTELLAKNIWITSCYPPTYIYKTDNTDHINQLLRRIDIIEYMDANNKFDPVAEVAVAEVNGGNTGPH